MEWGKGEGGKGKGKREKGKGKREKGKGILLILILVLSATDFNAHRLIVSPFRLSPFAFPRF
jgi:hypothetical protein